MGTELTVQQRAAVALESSKAAAELQALAESSKGITAITNRAGRDECHSAAMAATKARTGIVQAGKAARDDATRFSKAVIAEEARLVAIIQPEESRLKELRDSWDEKEKAEKAAKAEAERLRVLEITQRIALMKLAASNAAHFSVSSEGAAGILSAVEEIEIDSSFAEFFGEAKETHAAAVAEIRTTVEAKRASEEAAAKAQNERILAKIAAEEAARVAEQVRKEEAAAAKAKADAEAAERAERERVEAAARKAEQDKADELRRIEAEKLAAERKALDDARAKFEAEQAAARAVEEAARKELEAQARAEQEAKDAEARAELDKLEAAKRKKQEKETARSRDITNRREQIIFEVEQVEDLQMLADIYAAVVAIIKAETKEAA
jgi:hypothetical protein